MKSMNQILKMTFMHLVIFSSGILHGMDFGPGVAILIPVAIQGQSLMPTDVHLPPGTVLMPMVVRSSGVAHRMERASGASSYRAFYNAVRNNDLARMQTILSALTEDKKIEFVMRRNFLGQTVLHLAAQYGHAGAIWTLVGLKDLSNDKKIELIRLGENNSQSALHLAVAMFCQIDLRQYYSYGEDEEKLMVKKEAYRNVIRYLLASYKFFDIKIPDEFKSENLIDYCQGINDRELSFDFKEELLNLFYV